MGLKTRFDVNNEGAQGQRRKKLFWKDTKQVESRKTRSE
jgi:hypothetical protein